MKDKFGKESDSPSTKTTVPILGLADDDEGGNHYIFCVGRLTYEFRPGTRRRKEAKAARRGREKATYAGHC